MRVIVPLLMLMALATAEKLGGSYGGSYVGGHYSGGVSGGIDYEQSGGKGDFLRGIKDSKTHLLGGVVGSKVAFIQGIKNAKEALFTGIKDSIAAKKGAFENLKGSKFSAGVHVYPVRPQPQPVYPPRPQNPFKAHWAAKKAKIGAWKQDVKNKWDSLLHKKHHHHHPQPSHGGYGYYQRR